MLGRIPGRRGVVRFQHADFAFDDLRRWMRQLLRNADFGGVILTDIDERANRIYIGVEGVDVAARLQSVFERLAIPAQAVTLRTVRRPEKLATNDSLDSYSSPVIGGVMVQVRNLAQGGSKPHCTAGFNATIPPDTVQLYLVTNDHCTWQMGITTADTLWQPTYGAAPNRAIAVEVASAQFRAMPDTLCPVGAECRFSDAALFRYFNSSDGELGKIARPLWFSQGSTSFTLKRDTAEFQINGNLPTNRLIVVGEWLSKVGVSTGWSAGKLNRSGVQMSDGTGKYLVRQYEVKDVMGVGEAFARGGDSGAPSFRAVWSEDDPYNGTNWLGGLLHARAQDPSDQKWVYFASDINLLFADLGVLKTYPGPTCIPDPYYWGCQ